MPHQEGQQRGSADAGTGAPPHRAALLHALEAPLQALSEELQRAWQQQPLDRRLALEALARCVRTLREAGLPSEQVLLRIKHLLPVGRGPTTAQLATLADRNVLLSLTLAVYYRDADITVLTQLWPDVERRSGSPHPARSGARILRDTQGADWRVYERLDRRTPPDGAASLVFECDRCVRRTAIYPTDWRAVSDSELLKLVVPPAR